MSVGTALAIPAAARAALEQSHAVLLVDWHEDVPRSSLIASGYEVLSTHEGWFRHDVVDVPPKDASASFPPSAPDRPGYLVALPLSRPPARVDMVCTYRPAGEQLAYVRDLVVPLGAKWFWIERGDERFTHLNPVVPGASDEARAACSKAGVAVIEGLSIPTVLAAMKARPA